MMVRTQSIRFMLAAVVAMTTPAMAQYGSYNYGGSSTGAPATDSNCANGQCGVNNDYDSRPAPGYSSWGAPGRNVANDIDDWNTPAANLYRPASRMGSADFPDLPVSLSQRGSQGGTMRRFNDSGLGYNLRGQGPRLSETDRGFDWRTDYGMRLGDSVDRLRLSDSVGREESGLSPADPFRRSMDDRMNYGRGGKSNVEFGGRQTRNRIPLDRGYGDSLEQPSSIWDRIPAEGSPGIDQYGPIDNGRYEPLQGRDPFVPAPLPIGRGDSETEAINKLISARYQNPVNVRAVRAMSTNQAVNLFAEVSQKIDERHLQPSTYDLRVRRALRNLTLALDNPVFVQALGISSDSFRMDSFRNTLSSLAGSMRVSGYQDAKSVLNTVMQQAQSVPGLTPSVVGFEFANASIDTLDKFSGIEPADPGVPGASIESGTRSASLEDEIVGVGVEIKENVRGLLVVKSLRGGPAADAGIEPGDVIVAINGRSIEGVPMANSVDLMKGSSGSSMVVRIYRATKGERNFTLTRRKIRVWTVNDTRLLQGSDVGYLSLSRFAQNSTAELDQALSELHSQGMKSLIIDLRGNPGGLLTTCVEISDRFVPCGTIVSTKGRLNTDNMVEKANWSKTWSTPLVVLVDGDSASASEIFAAAIQENQRGVVVGTKSYGKGSVQTHFPLNAISGNLRLTTAKFYSPKGREMAGQGVTPDVFVDDADGVENGDQVLARALQIAQSSRLQEMAKAAGTCRPGSPAAARSSSLKDINDFTHVITAVR